MDDYIEAVFSDDDTVEAELADVSSSGSIQESKSITANGTYYPDYGYDGVAQMNVNVPNPSTGSLSITENGTYDVTEKASAVVAVPQPTGSVNISSNGTVDVTDYASAVVDVQPSLQNKTVTPMELGQEVVADTGYDGLACVSVNAIPSEYVIPSGSVNITENGTHDVSGKASAVVNVPQPSGSISITENGTHDVTDYASAVVNVETEPTLEALSVTENGTYTPESGVDGFNSVAVNVPTPVDRFTKIATVELTANYGNVVELANAICSGFTAENNKLYYFILQGGRASAIESQIYEYFYIGNLAPIASQTAQGFNIVPSRYKSSVAENRRFIINKDTYVNANNIGDKYDVYEVNLP